MVLKHSALQQKGPTGDPHHSGQQERTFSLLGKPLWMPDSFYPRQSPVILVSTFLSLGDLPRVSLTVRLQQEPTGKCNGATLLTPPGFYCFPESWGTRPWQFPICKQHLAFSLHFHRCFCHEVATAPPSVDFGSYCWKKEESVGLLCCLLEQLNYQRLPEPQQAICCGELEDQVLYK